MLQELVGCIHLKHTRFLNIKVLLLGDFIMLQYKHNKIDLWLKAYQPCIYQT